MNFFGARTSKLSIFALTLWAVCPTVAQAQSDPDWARREMERMQAQQERFDAQVERQRAEQERWRAQQDRDVARAARQRAEQDRQAVYDRADATNSPSITNDTNRPITFDRLMAIFEVAKDVCPEGRDEAFGNALGLLSDDEGALLSTYCIMYINGLARTNRQKPD